ncbi:hypothetical protein ACP3TC_07545 [Winslowiella sp. 2C04]|uniref:hypothetical protein n=1 Tax=Winslowiella sp. 2C04 TaxID=3416179 RepID=UPI003CEBD2DA
MISKQEPAFIEKSDGTRLGPYKGTFAGSTVIIDDPNADIDDGDKVIRTLPNQKEEIKLIKSCEFFNNSLGTYGPHYQLQVGSAKMQPASSATTQHINVSGGTVQIGNHNRIEFKQNIESLISIINDSVANEEDKNAAKGLLKKFLEHPLLVSIAGTTAGSFF